ncbi:site-specific integrase, partial [Listeria monocytogenes]|nr:site-specific integrase [Listeria monocytogenes]
PKTRHSKRSVSLDENTIVILKHWQKRQKEYLLQFGHKTNESNQLVFSSTDNSFIQLSKPRTWMLQTINKNSLREITIHGFRHTHATLLLEAGVEPKTISERLGHSSIQITLDLYSHVTEQMEKKVPDIFSKVMENI